MLYFFEGNDVYIFTSDLGGGLTPEVIPSFAIKASF